MERKPVLYHCVIGAADGRLLLLPADEGRWALPVVFDLSNRWLQDEVDTIGRQIAARYGLRATVLRHLDNAAVHQVCELEADPEGWTVPEGGLWVDRAVLAQLNLKWEAQRELLDRWLVEKESRRVPDVRPPWERAGWLAGATAWIETQLERLRIVASGPIQPVKTAWSRSVVLRVATGAGNFYFKAVFDKPPFEGVVVRELAERFPKNVPYVAAFDVPRRWMLMPDFGGTFLGAMPAESWAGAVRRFAEIQLECATAPGFWADLGCPDRSGGAMRRLWRQMLADTPARAEPNRALQPAEIASLEGMTSSLEMMWDWLDDFGVFRSLHLEDFRRNNVVVVGDEYLFFDWSDCVVAHPFFSVQRMLDFLRPPPGVRSWDGCMNHPDDSRRRIRDAYLEPWTACAPPDQLREIFVLTRYLNEAYQAVRWYLELPYLEPGCPWHARVVDTHIGQLRRLLDLEPELTGYATAVAGAR